jgi:hypothetical protein
MVVTPWRDRAVVRARAPGPARTRRGRVPWTFLAVLAATVLATLGLFAMSSSAGAEGGTRSMAVGPLSPPAASVSPAGTERPDPATGVSAPVTSPDADPNLAGGSDLDPSADGKELVTLALLVLVLFGVGGGRRTADDAQPGACVGGVEHVPKVDPMGQLCLDALAPAAPASVRRARVVPTGVEAGWCRSDTSTVRPRAVRSSRASVPRWASRPVDARPPTPTGRPLMQAPPQMTSPGWSPGRAPGPRCA